MSSECKRQGGRKPSKSKIPDNEFNGQVGTFNDRKSFTEDLGLHNSSGHYLMSGQEWNMENQRRSPRNKKGNLEKVNKGRRDSPRGGNPSLSYSSRPQQQQSLQQVNATDMFHTSDAEVPTSIDGHLTMSLGARPKLFPRQGSTQSSVSQLDKDSPKFKIVSKNDKQMNKDEVSIKLKQIRDYINQISSTIEALENLRDPSVFEKLERLRKVRTDLEENEHQLVDLLEKISILNREALDQQSTRGSFNQENQVRNNEESSDASADSDEDVENETHDDGNEEHGSELFLKHSDLLKKMADSQEKLKALQDHQAMLLNLKRRVESQLSDSRVLHDHFNQQSDINMESLSRDERPAPIGHHQAQENKQRRFPSLQDQRGPNESHVVNLVDADEVIDFKYREFQKKWLGLQNEKDQIDLLRELHLLQDNKMLESATLQRAGEKLAAFEQNCSKSKRNSNSPRVSCDSEGGASIDRTKKVEDKKWLKSLQGVESTTPKKLSIFNHDEPMVFSDHVQEENKDEQPLRLKKARKTKKSNLSFNKEENEIDSNVSPNTSTDIQQRLDFLISELHENLDDVHLEDRTKKLSAAKTKLQKLQGILSAVQQAQNDGENISADYIEQLLDTVDSDELIYNEVQPKENIRPNHRFKNQASTVETSKTNETNDSKSSRKFAFDNPRQTQRMDPVGMNDSRRESNSSHDVAALSSLDSSRDCSNDLWQDMERRLTLTAELRQRRRELESLMKKDAGKSYFLNQDIKEENQSAKSEPLHRTTASVAADSMSTTTWGGLFDNETREAVDGTNDSQEEKTEVVEDEDYSSDGLVVDGANVANGQSEQYENRSSKVTNRISPSVATANENRLPTRTNPGGPVPGAELPSGDSAGMSVRKRSVQTQRPSTHSLEQFTIMDGLSNASVYEDQPNHDSVKISIQNANMVAATSAAAHSQPIETTSLLYQTFIRDQNIMDGLARQSLLPNGNVVPQFNSPESYNLQQNQLQQQMLLGLSQCYKLLYLQNVETQRLQQMVQSCLPHVEGASCPESYLSFTGRSNSCETGESHVPPAPPQWHRDNITSANSHAHRITATLSSTIPDSHETLNNQVAPGNRANNYWDNFRSYSRQNLLSNVHHLNKSNDGMGRYSCQPDLHLKTHLVNVCESHELRQPALIQEHVASNEERLLSERAKSSPRRTSGLHDHSDSSVIMKPSKNKVNKEPSQLSNNNKSSNKTTPNSKAVINCGNIFNNSTSTHVHPGATSLSGMKPTSLAPAASTSSDRRETGGELSGNYSHTEGEIQTAVTKLLSRCYGESDVIVDLLRELQKLNSQQELSCALQVIRNFVTDYAKNQMDATLTGGMAVPMLSKESSSSDADVEMRTIHHHQGCLPKDRPRFAIAQDSSSDDDSYPNWAQVRRSRQTNETSHATERKREQRGQQQPSAPDVKVVHVGSKKPFPNKSGVIRKLYKNRASPSLQQPSHQQHEVRTVITPVEDLTMNKSNADVDLASSDVPQSTRFNAQQLETQMQDVMSSVTSFVTLISSRSFNSTLMGIVSSRMIDLVLSMVDNLNEYTISFVPGHLESVLSNILPKYFGKRVSECETSLITELSEILYNELSLLQLMQNMVNGNKSLKLAYPTFDNGRNLEARGQASSAASYETQVTINSGYHATSQPKGNFTEATDADLVLTTKRGDDDDNEKSKEDFSCDIPDVCVSHENSGALSNVIMDERSPPIFRSVTEARNSSSNSAASHRESHNPTPLQMSELIGAVVGLEEACAPQTRYFDLEVELEESLGDTQDLAEADQTHRYLGGESLDDDVHDECLESWTPSHSFCNGDMERTEDDQQDENVVIGAVGGVNSGYQTTNTVDVGNTRALEATLDEVPIKLRVSGSAAPHESPSESDSTRKTDGSNQDKQGRRERVNL